jgi:uncharacterized protein (DUF2267 family)
MTLDFEKYAKKGNEFLHHLEDNLNTEDRAHAGRILRSTFRVLRNHLTFEESLQLLAQLPIALKGVYVDGWSAAAHRKIKTAEEFLYEIVQEDGNNAWRDFSNEDEILLAVRAVLNTLRIYVSGPELDQALGTLPTKVRRIFESSEQEEEL